MRATWYGVATALESPRDTHWSTRASCVGPGVYMDWWHSTSSAIRATTLHICHTHCPVFEACRADAFAHPPASGVVQGGLLWSNQRPVRWEPKIAELCTLCGGSVRAPGCGTPGGAKLHRKRHERVCPWCAEAEQRRRAERERKAARR